MRLTRHQLTGILACTCALGVTSAAVALGAAIGGSVTGGSVTKAGVTKAATADAAAPAGPGFVPGVIHIGRSRADAPASTQDCVEQLGLPCYDPAQIQQAYNLNGIYSQNITGKGVTIAIVDAYGSPTISADLAQFDSAYGLPNPSLKIISPIGSVPSFNGGNASMAGWAGETTLDVEWAHAIAPGANILLVETPTAGGQSGADFSKAEDYVVRHHLAQIISQSFGAPEQAEGPSSYIDSLRGAYLDADKDHVTVLASTGDNGATGPENNSSDLYTYPVTSWPATDPLVTAVGGTELHLSADGSRTSPDTVWNDTYNQAANKLDYDDDGPNAMASGGGKSAYFTRPSYQDSVRQTVGAYRGIPDISMNAACSSSVNTYQSFPGQQSGWYEACGTSESAPLFAGVVALADQYAGHSLGLINPALYKLAAEHAPGIVPVTSGNNSVAFKQHGRMYYVHGFTARNGYSRAAGVGTIDGLYFVPELARL
jgi:subtilase family serine protease